MGLALFPEVQPASKEKIDLLWISFWSHCIWLPKKIWLKIICCELSLWGGIWYLGHELAFALALCHVIWSVCGMLGYSMSLWREMPNWVSDSKCFCSPNNQPHTIYIQHRNTFSLWSYTYSEPTPICCPAPPIGCLYWTPSVGANTTTNASKQKCKSSNASASSMGKHKSSNAGACTLGPSKWQHQNSPSPTLGMDTALTSHIRSVSPTPSPALSSVSSPTSVSESFYSLPPSSSHWIHLNVSKLADIDLWWFFVGITSKDPPALLLPVELPATKSMQPNMEQFPYIHCVLW